MSMPATCSWRWAQTLEPHPVDAQRHARRARRWPVSTLVYVTPGHQSPTNVTMSMERRLSLVAAARAAMIS